MIKDPEQLGFRLGLKIRIGQPASITQATRPATTDCDVVYVALLAENNRALKKGDALKIGQTRGSLMSRWKGIVGIFKPHRKLRKNEKNDLRKWLKLANGKEVSVWMKAAGKIKVPYAKGLTRSRFSTRGAEEEFLDQYCQPKLGIRLNGERNEDTD